MRRPGSLRSTAVALFALAALLSGLAGSLHARWLDGLAFAAFALGAVAFLRWRQAMRAKVFAREEKTIE